MSRSEKDMIGRRGALARLGLAVTAVYSAPTVLHLDRQARAVQPSCTGKGKGKGNPWCKGKGTRKDSSDRRLEEWKRKNGNRYAYGRSDGDRDRDGRGNDSYREKGRTRDKGRDRDGNGRPNRIVKSGFSGSGSSRSRSDRGSSGRGPDKRR